jgi:hypothetical protein
MSTNNTLSPTPPRPIALPPITFPSSTFYTNFSSILGELSKSKKFDMFFHNTLSQTHSPPPAVMVKKMSNREILAQKIICCHERQSYVDAVKRGVIAKLYEPIFFRDVLRGITNFK